MYTQNVQLVSYGEKKIHRRNANVKFGHTFLLTSSPEHQKTDWLGIHEKICQLLIPLRTPVPILGSEEDRQHRKSQQVIRQVDLLFEYKSE